MAAPFTAELARRMMRGHRFEMVSGEVFEIIRSAAASKDCIDVEFDAPFTPRELADFYAAKDGCLPALIADALGKMGYAVKPVQIYPGVHRVNISWEKKE